MWSCRKTELPAYARARHAAPETGGPSPSYEELAVSVAELRESVAPGTASSPRWSGCWRRHDMPASASRRPFSEGEPWDNPAPPAEKGKGLAATAIAWPRPIRTVFSMCQLFVCPPAAGRRGGGDATPTTRTGRPLVARTPWRRCALGLLHLDEPQRVQRFPLRRTPPHA